MSTTQPQSTSGPRKADLLERLTNHRAFGSVPREELEWLVAHGTLERYEPGALIARKGEPVEAMYIILSGHVSHLTDQGGTWRKVMDFREGDITGQLPYSRMLASPGNSIVQESTEVVRIDRQYLAEIPIVCPHVTEALVHVMVDRARTFKVSDLQVEKMASLGKLAAGLAHELNNPASAAARSAHLVEDALTESDSAARALGAAGLDARELAVIDRVRAACLASPTTSVRTPLERADREEAVSDWLDDHHVDDSLADSLADTEVTIDGLDELAAAVTGDKLGATLRWLAAGCTVRRLAHDIENAASRVHALVSAVKGFTYMGHATTPEPVELTKGLGDTLAVLAAKARDKSVSLSIDAPPDLPHARGFGGELNQVWVNLIDNAIDAVKNGGRVTVTVRAEAKTVVVTVADDGPGIPDEIKSRIFDPFFTTKGVGKGTGLGLDIVRRIVDRSDGRIDVESKPGRTEFRVSLPVA